MGCTCHDFINPNGYGKCNKASSYEHIKNKAVCYVNQPSNCSDLAYSTTNRGKKFSAEACELGKPNFTFATFYLKDLASRLSNQQSHQNVVSDLIVIGHPIKSLSSQVKHLLLAVEARRRVVANALEVARVGGPGIGQITNLVLLLVVVGSALVVIQ